MHRLVIGLTSLLTLVGVAVIAGYLFVFGPSTDRAATVAPRDTAIYLSVYLTPSSGQQRNLGELLAKLPGFADQAALPAKIDELAQRFVGSTGLDYHRDVAPWLGDELAVAIGNPATPSALLIAAVKSDDAAQQAISRIAAQQGSTTSSAVYQGIALTTLSGGAGQGGTYTIVNHQLLVSTDPQLVRAAVDAAVGRADSLADAASFREAMASLPADRVASLYVDLPASARAAASGAAASLRGFSHLALGAVLQPDGLVLTGSAPVDAASLDSTTRAVLGLAGETASLTAWMPETTEAELVLFGARQSFDGLVGQLGSAPGGEQIASSLTQLRALAALGLGIDLDRDLLPLFDHEAALAVSGLSGSAPRGELLLRPGDPAAAAASLTRLAAALRGHGSQVSEAQVSGATVTTATIPQVGQIAWAVSDGVVVAGLSADDVGAALAAHASGKTLAATADYATAFERSGGRAGYELFVSGARAGELLAGLIALPSDARDMLSHLGGLALWVAVRDNQIEIHATVTVH